jgi:Rrf2 family protein
MVYLAGVGDDPVNSESIAAATKVSPGYLSKVLRDLVVADLIVSQRGPNGGFTLARPAESVSILEIINAVDPIKRILECPLGNPEHTKLCPLHRRMDQTIADIQKTLTRTKLSEVLGGMDGNGDAGRSTAHQPKRTARTPRAAAS